MLLRPDGGVVEDLDDQRAGEALHRRGLVLLGRHGPAPRRGRGEGKIGNFTEIRLRVAKFGAAWEDRRRLRIQFADEPAPAAAKQTAPALAQWVLFEPGKPPEMVQTLRETLSRGFLVHTAVARRSPARSASASTPGGGRVMLQVARRLRHVHTRHDQLIDARALPRPVRGRSVRGT